MQFTQMKICHYFFHQRNFAVDTVFITINNNEQINEPKTHFSYVEFLIFD